MLITYSLLIMLDSHVVVQSVCFVPDDVERKSLQSSVLQQKHTVINTLNNRSLYLYAVVSFLKILPVDDDDDVDLQSCVFQPLLCTT